jgi:putative salt-induced outer membrane protein
MKRLPSSTILTSLLVLGLVASATVSADDDKETGWSDSAELGIVATSGNSEATTLGFNNVLRHTWDTAEFFLELGAVRVESRPGGIAGVGGAGNFVEVEPAKEVDAERYFLKSGYGREISPRLFWNVGLEGEQNRPSGIDQRVAVTAGVGNNWFLEKENVTFRTAYNVAYTDEEFTQGPGADFAGLRLAYDYKHKLTESTDFESNLVVDGNFDEAEDYRAEFFNAVTVSISKRMALKAGLRLIFRNLPPSETITLFDDNPFTNPAANPTGTALVAKDDLDSIFSTSLVVTF